MFRDENVTFFCSRHSETQAQLSNKHQTKLENKTRSFKNNCVLQRRPMKAYSTVLYCFIKHVSGWQKNAKLQLLMRTFTTFHTGQSCLKFRADISFNFLNHNHFNMLGQVNLYLLVSICFLFPDFTAFMEHVLV